jgi:GNAT superfamily N-acetyltransferase
MAVTLAEVSGAEDRRTFLRFPWRVYAGDPNWVPPLLRDVDRLTDPTVHPFHRHAEVAHFLARRDGQPVGRIAACVNRLHNQTHGDRTGFFGFFETVDDAEVARTLLDGAGAWLAARGMDRMRGPASYSTNEECGLLVEGFDRPPVVMMAYNPPYYRTLIEGMGFEKSQDLLAYDIRAENLSLRGMERVAESAKIKQNIQVRPGNLKRFDREVQVVREVYNQAWSRNWGFVPMTEEELAFAAADMKAIIDPRLLLFAEQNGQPIGFALSIPDINLALKHLDGRLFPFGWAKFLWHKRKIHSLRVITLGVIPEFVNRGAAQILFYETIRRGIDAGYPHAEISWVLESNPLMSHAATRLGGVLYTRYRVYDRTLPS